ncbi:MAG: hypothetical protein ACR2OM_02885 [Aestuariivirgaceae bacterium]
MAKRHDLRALYIAGWYEMDVDKLLAATAKDFMFDDPAEPRPVRREDLTGYMQRWLKRTNGCNEWRLSHEVREDKDGVLTDWEWWEVVGTDLNGTAVVTTSDAGVHLERITYFARELHATGDDG